jgi:hypothetical protein
VEPFAVRLASSKKEFFFRSSGKSSMREARGADFVDLRTPCFEKIDQSKHPHIEIKMEGFEFSERQRGTRSYIDSQWLPIIF